VGKPVPKLPEKLGHSFGGDPARFAKHWDDPKRDARQKPDEVVQLLAIKPGMTVADVGAGTGYFLARLSAAVGGSGKVLALDIEPKMVDWLTARIAKEKLTNAGAAKVAPDDPRLAPKSVDRVLVVNTWHHIGSRAAYAHKVGAALRPGGKLVIVDFNLDASEGPPVHERLTAEQVAAELEQAGLRPEVLTETLVDHFIVAGTK
jgi:predicted methyltransferase